MFLALILSIILGNDWGSPPACEGDANRDGVVNILDLSLTVSNLGKGTEPYRYGDTDGDSIVTLNDLYVERDNYGAICQP